MRATRRRLCDIHYVINNLHEVVVILRLYLSLASPLLCVELELQENEK